MSVLEASAPSKIIPCISRDPAGTPCDLGVIARMPVAQLDPAHGARLFECDRSCWKSGLRAARLTNAYQRRPSAPPRKMTADPVQCGGQTVPVHMSAFSRHVSIMRLLPLGRARSLASARATSLGRLYQFGPGHAVARGLRGARARQYRDHQGRVRASARRGRAGGGGVDEPGSVRWLRCSRGSQRGSQNNKKPPAGRARGL